MNSRYQTYNIAHMLVGIPGSGKTTFRNEFKLFDGLPVASSDDYIEWIAKQRGHTYNEVFKELIDSATKGVESSIVGNNALGLDFVIDRTNVNIEKSLNHWKSLIRERGGIVPVFNVWILNTSLLDCEYRNAQRPEGRKIPSSVLQSMFVKLQTSIRNLEKIKRKNPDDQFFVVY